MMNAVVIGLGRIGAGFQRDPLRTGVVTHARAFQVHPRCTLVAGVDPDPTQRRAFEADFDVPTYATWKEMAVHHTVDLVSVCTPPESHNDVVLSAIAEGAQRAVCEKPFTPSLQSAMSLLTSIGDDAIRVGVNYSRRYDPLHRLLLDPIDRIVATTGHYTAGILNTGGHWIATLIHAGARVCRVRAVSSGCSGEDPTPLVVLELDDGALATMHGHDVDRYLVYEIDFFTPSQRVVFTESGKHAKAYDVGPSPHFNGYSEFVERNESLPTGLIDPLLHVVDDAVTSIDESRPMLCSVDDAILVHRIIDAVRRSLLTSDWVDVR